MVKLSVGDEEKITVRFEGDKDTPAFIMAGDRIHFATVYEQRNKYLRLHGEIERLENSRQILRAERDKFERWWRAATEELETYKKEVGQHCAAEKAKLKAERDEFRKSYELAATEVDFLKGNLPADFVTQSRWRDIATAPKDETAILVVGRRDFGAGEDHVVVAQWGRMCERWCIVGGDAFVYPIRWMPLPATPKSLNPGTPKKAVIEHWREIATAPKDGTFFLGRSTNPYCQAAVMRWSSDGLGGWDIHGMYSHAITHWMPLPKFEPKGA